MPLGLNGAQRTAYLARLFGSHDYRIDVDILDLDERPKGTAVLLDGQVNLVPGDKLGAIRRTASLTVSDPAGMLDFHGSAKWTGSTVWVDRLIRITHTLTVPGVGIPGNAVTVTAFIGPPSTISREGADVSVECQDKTALAVRGASPLTIPKGTNAVNAIRRILRERTGEFRFRLGTTTRRLSQPYSVGWSDEASPWLVASRIAENELGQQLIYSCDGYATLRPLPTAVGLVVPHVLAEPASDIDFTDLINWVRVRGKVTTTTTKTTSGSLTTTVKKTSQPQAIAQATSGYLTPGNIARKGVKRYLPLLIKNDTLTNQAQVRERATRELTNGTKLEREPQVTCIPFFHADVDDRIQFTVPGADLILRLKTAAIPLGPGEMSIGSIRWVSAVPRLKAATRRLRTVTRKRKPAKKTTKKAAKKTTAKKTAKKTTRRRSGKR